MGFLDSLKSVKNMVTGGAAEVKVEIEDFTIGQVFNVHVSAKVDSSDLKIEKVYLYVRGEEEYLVIEERETVDEYGDVYYEEFENWRTDETFRGDMDVSGEQTLHGGQTYNWTAQVLIPEGSRPIEEGNNNRHYYKVCAGLDAMGNDPDSGWVEVEG